MEVRPAPQGRRRRFRADLYKFVTLARTSISPTPKRAHVLASHWAKNVKSRPALCFRRPCAAGAGRLFRSGPTSRVPQRREEPDRALDETDSGSYKRASVGPAVSFRAQTRFARRPDIAPHKAQFRSSPPAGDCQGYLFCGRCVRTPIWGFGLVFEMVRDAGAAH